VWNCPPPPQEKIENTANYSEASWNKYIERRLEDDPRKPTREPDIKSLYARDLAE
jgi:hypothetical protein